MAKKKKAKSGEEDGEAQEEEVATPNSIFGFHVEGYVIRSGERRGSFAQSERPLDLPGLERRQRASTRLEVSSTPSVRLASGVSGKRVRRCPSGSRS